MKECAGCGTASVGELPAHGPETCAQAANLAVDFEPAQQQRASRVARQLIEARDAASAARAADQNALDAAILGHLVTHYRALATAGLAASLHRRTATAKDVRRLARRFRTFEDMILRLATRLDLDIFSGNEAERTIWSAKVQERSSGGCWRTLEGLAECAFVRPICPPPRKGLLANSTPYATFSTVTPGTRPGLEPAG